MSNFVIIVAGNFTIVSKKMEVTVVHEQVRNIY